MGESALPAKDLHPEGHEEHHSAVAYVVVWIALLGFTALTYITGTAHLGKWALTIALAIAVAKSTLVALIFMHLRSSPKLTALVVGSAVLFLAILIVVTASDYFTRAWLPIYGK